MKGKALTTVLILGLGMLILSACGEQQPINIDKILAQDKTYVGSDTCKMCHLEHYDSWKMTQHSRMIQAGIQRALGRVRRTSQSDRRRLERDAMRAQQVGWRREEPRDHPRARDQSTLRRNGRSLVEPGQRHRGVLGLRIRRRCDRRPPARAGSIHGPAQLHLLLRKRR